MQGESGLFCPFATLCQALADVGHTLRLRFFYRRDGNMRGVSVLDRLSADHSPVVTALEVRVGSADPAPVHAQIVPEFTFAYTREAR